jgi:hypothetical protein
LAADSSTGYGCDNMTAMLILLNIWIYLIISYLQ